MKAINIQWDTDSDKELLELPKEIEIPSFIKEDEDSISDYITDKTGFCHKGFELLKDYYIPVTWQVWDKVKIEATSLKEAIKYVKGHIDEIPLGTEPEYIDGSYQIDDGNNGQATVEETLQHLKEYWNLGGEYDESEFTDKEPVNLYYGEFWSKDDYWWGNAELYIAAKSLEDAKDILYAYAQKFFTINDETLHIRKIGKDIKLVTEKDIIDKDLYEKHLKNLKNGEFYVK